MSVYRLSYPGRAEFCAFYNILRQWPLNLRRLLILPPRCWGGGILSTTEGTDLFMLVFYVTFVLCGQGAFDVVFTSSRNNTNL